MARTGLLVLGSKDLYKIAGDSAESCFALASDS